MRQKALRSTATSTPTMRSSENDLGGAAPVSGDSRSGAGFANEYRTRFVRVFELVGGELGESRTHFGEFGAATTDGASSTMISTSCGRSGIRSMSSAAPEARLPRHRLLSSDAGNLVCRKSARSGSIRTTHSRMSLVSQQPCSASVRFRPLVERGALDARRQRPCRWP